jgi:hypothetical protein
MKYAGAGDQRVGTSSHQLCDILRVDAPVDLNVECVFAAQPK